MRKSVEGLLLWFVPIAFLTFIAGSAAFALHDRATLDLVATALGMPALELGLYLKLSHPLILVAGNIVVAGWLAFQHHASVSRRALWSLFGLTSGLWALAIWLLVELSGPEAAGDG